MNNYTIFLLFIISLLECSCSDTNHTEEFRPTSPLVKCSFLSWEFIECQEPVDHKGNKTAKEERGYGCIKFGGMRYEDVEKTQVLCNVLPQIECYGNKTFFKKASHALNIPISTLPQHYCTVSYQDSWEWIDFVQVKLEQQQENFLHLVELEFGGLSTLFY